MHTEHEMPALPPETQASEDQHKASRLEANARELRPKAITQSKLVGLWVQEHRPKDGGQRLQMELAWATTYAAMFSEMYDAKPGEGAINSFRQIVDDCDGSEGCLRQIQDILDQQLGHH